jgi:hypothetical protein
MIVVGQRYSGYCRPGERTVFAVTATNFRGTTSTDDLGATTHGEGGAYAGLSAERHGNATGRVRKAGGTKSDMTRL